MAEPRLDPRICKEFVNISSFHNTVITNESGRRKVNEMWDEELQAFRIQYVTKWKGTDEQKIARAKRLIAFWKMMRGNARCFRFKNWSDYKDDGKGRVALVDGVYRLVRDYHDPSDENEYTIKIWKPVADTIVLGGGASGGVLDPETGIVTGDVAAGTWTGEFDLWVHFVEESIGNVAYDSGGILSWNGLSVMQELLEQ